MERGIRKRQAALADAEAEARAARRKRSPSQPVWVSALCVEVKEWTGKLAVLEAEEAELLKSLQARQEIRRQKRAAVVKEALEKHRWVAKKGHESPHHATAGLGRASWPGGGARLGPRALANVAFLRRDQWKRRA